MHSVNAGVTKSNTRKRESNTTAAAISSNVIEELEPKSESVDVHALKSRFEAKSDVSPSVTHAKLTSAASGCIEKSPGCPSAAGLTGRKGSDFGKVVSLGKVVSRSHSLSLQDLLDNSENKTNTIPRSDVRELEKSAVLERAEIITQPIRKPRKFFFSRNPVSKAEMTTRSRSKSQENLLDVSEKGRQVGPCGGARSSAARSFQEKKVTSKSTDVEVVKARNLTSALAIASSSDDDHYSYEDPDYLSSEDANSTANRSFKLLFERASTQSDSKSAKDSKSKKPPKSPKCKRPLPRPPKEDSNVGKPPQTPPPLETNAQERYLKISHAAAAAAAYDGDGENQYASLRQDFDISKCSVVSPSDDDDVSWRGAEKEWRKMKDAAEIPRDVDVARLTVNEVGHCLRLLKMKKYVKKFKRRVVDGAVLVTLTDAMLMETFKMDQLDARKIVMFSKENWRPSKK